MSMSPDELQEAARRLLTKYEGANASCVAAPWQQIADAGFLCVGVPEHLGGLGMGLPELTALHIEMGRALACGPLIGQAMAIAALSACDGMPAAQEALERAMAGAVIAMPLAPAELRLSPQGRLNGRLPAVCDAHRAERVLLVSRTEAIAVLVPANAADIDCVPRDSWDETRCLSDIVLENVALEPAHIIARGDLACEIAERTESIRSLLLAADTLGGANELLGRTVEFLALRRQFGRPLAMFQALKHRIANLKTCLAASEALLWERAHDSTAGAPEMTAVKAHATQLFAWLAEEAVQLHGGIALTAEHYCHRFLKRALLNAALGGDNDSIFEAVGRNRMNGKDP